MNDKTKYVKNLLGAVSKVKFYIPFKDNANYEYVTNLDLQKNFTFGLQSNNTLRSGIEIKASTTIKLYAGFNGQVFFTPSRFSETVGMLHLVILPETALSLRLTLPPEASFPIEIVYMPVNKQKVKEAIKVLMQTRGLLDNEVNNTLKAFMSDEMVGIMVNGGDEIGQAAESKARIEFWDSDAHFINPIYLLWKWNILQMLSPSTHNFLTKLQLSELNLVIENGRVVSQKQHMVSMDLGPYDFISRYYY